MTQSRERQRDESGISEEVVREVLDHWSITYKHLNYAADNDPTDIPYLVVDHETHFGIEAHLFTIADMALWIPELLPSGDIVIYLPIRNLDSENGLPLAQRRMLSWDTLMHTLDWVMHRVKVGRAKYGEPSESWAHCEREEDGYYEIPENPPIPIEKIMRWVDPSIKDVVLELNRHGFVTIESCSGFRQDHEGRNPFGAYVCFDDEYYHDVSAHLFTLAEAAGWDPTFGAHGFDVMFHANVEGEKDLVATWRRLEELAGEFGEYLEDYRSYVVPSQEYYYYRFRRERHLFSKFYSEQSKTLNGFIEELETIDKEFYEDE